MRVPSLRNNETKTLPEESLVTEIQPAILYRSALFQLTIFLFLIPCLAE